MRHTTHKLQTHIKDTDDCDRATTPQNLCRTETASTRYLCVFLKKQKQKTKI